jgi:hypothetical protein
MMSGKTKRVFLSLILVLVFCDMAVPQGQSEHALIQLPVMVTSDPPDTVWKMNKADAASRLGTQLFIDQVSAALSFYMTPYPSYELWSGVSFHLDNGWNRVVYLECMDSWIRAFGDRGGGTGEFLWPSGIDARALCGYWGPDWYYHDSYYIYVADASNDRIIELRYNWQLQQMEWLAEFTGGGLDLPKNLDINNGGTFAFNDNDYLWVVNGQQIKRFTMDGILRNTYGYYDCDPNGVGNFCRPTAVACGRTLWPEVPDQVYANDNRIYVADNGNHRIVLMEKDSVSEDISWLKTLLLPYESDVADLEVDNFGQVWAVDKANGRIYKYTSDLYPLCYYGSFGTARNEFYYPGSISNSGGYLGGGNMYVTESWGDSSGGQYFSMGTDVLDFEVTSSVDYRWHYINYVLVDPSDVTIEIYDEEDQLVDTLFDARESSGACIHVWDGTDQFGQPVYPGAYRVVLTDSSNYKSIETGGRINGVVKEAWLHHEGYFGFAPFNLVARQWGPGMVKLEWAYKFHRSPYIPHTIYCNGCLCGSTGPFVETYIDSGLVPGLNYIYWVKAYWEDWESPPSNADTVFLWSKPLFPSATHIVAEEESFTGPLALSEYVDSADVAISYHTVYPGHFAEIEVQLKNPMPICGFNFLIKLAHGDLVDFHTEAISIDSILIGSQWLEYPVRECWIDTSGTLIGRFNSINSRGQVGDTSSSDCKYLWVKGWAPPGECILPNPNYQTLFKFGIDAQCISDTSTHRSERFHLTFGRLYSPEQGEVPLKYHWGDATLWWSVPGDANNDSLVNVGDVVFLVSHLYGGGPQPCIPESGDANGDCIINVGDVVYLTTYLYRGGPAPLPGCWHGKRD